MNTTINNRIECNEPHANLDSYYGPYEDVKAALEALPEEEMVNGVTYTKRHVGLTVGIGKESIVEYWFDGGTKDDNLKKKITDGGLPGGVKIVMFDKNSGSGVQPSLLTDMDGYVVLPTPSVTRSGYNFTGWKLGATTYQTGAEVQVTDNASFVAQWEKIKYTVSWNNGSNVTITGTCDGNDINSGEPCNSGSSIVLTATPDTGYEFKNWINAPSGATQTGNILEFTLTGNVSGISAEAEYITHKTKLTCNFDKETGVDMLEYTDDKGTTKNLTSGMVYEIDSNIKVTLNPTFLNDYRYDLWTGLEQYEGQYDITESGVLTFNAIKEGEINLKVTGTK